MYNSNSELIVTYTICVRTLLQQVVSEPVFYGDLIYKFKTIERKPKIRDGFKAIIKHKRVVNDMDIMRQSSCLVLNQITV